MGWRARILRVVGVSQRGVSKELRQYSKNTVVIMTLHPKQNGGLSQDELLHGVEIEDIRMDANNPTYVLVTRRIDWENARLPRRIRFQSSPAPALIKYSAAKFSPVSSSPAKHIRLATPAFFRHLEPNKNSALIADELDSAFVDKLNWGKEGRTEFEVLKKWFRDRQSRYELTNFDVTLTLSGPKNLMYCTSIAPESRHERKKQQKHLSKNYNFMTRIDNPTCFATQLGYEYAKQVKINEDLKCKFPELFALESPLVKDHIEKSLKHVISNEGISASAKSVFTESLARNKETANGYIILVDHGTVVYLDGGKIGPFISGIPEIRRAEFVPFVKHTEYTEQQEYRFVISVKYHEPKIDTFDLVVSDELKSLMTPLGTV